MSAVISYLRFHKICMVCINLTRCIRIVKYLHTHRWMYTCQIYSQSIHMWITYNYVHISRIFFGIKYYNNHDTIYLFNLLRSNYKISTDWKSALYIRITPTWTYHQRTIDLYTSSASCISCPNVHIIYLILIPNPYLVRINNLLHFPIPVHLSIPPVSRIYKNQFYFTVLNKSDELSVTSSVQHTTNWTSFYH